MVGVCARAGYRDEERRLTDGQACREICSLGHTVSSLGPKVHNFATTTMYNITLPARKSPAVQPHQSPKTEWSSLAGDECRYMQNASGGMLPQESLLYLDRCIRSRSQALQYLHGRWVLQKLPGRYRPVGQSARHPARAVIHVDQGLQRGEGRYHRLCAHPDQMFVLDGNYKDDTTI